MKPLIIVILPEYTSQKTHDECVKHFDDIQKDGGLTDYEVIVISGGTAKVYYPTRNWLTFYYYKIKAWVILRIKKRK